jgi:hypothetical protein
MKAIITRSEKTSVEPKTKSKRETPINPTKKEDEAKAKVELELRSKKEGVNLGKASPKDVSDTHIFPFPR